MNAPEYRMAKQEDAPFLAHCVRDVSHGVVDALLSGLLPNVSAEQLLTMVMGDSSSQYSYTNCLLVEMSAKPIGLLFCYPDTAQVLSPLLNSVISKKRLNPLLDILTAVVTDSLYINTIWVDIDYRGQGLADVLIEYAQSWAKELSLSKLSLFAFDNNTRALAFYTKHGFSRVRDVETPEYLSTQHGGGALYQCLLA